MTRQYAYQSHGRIVPRKTKSIELAHIRRIKHELTALRPLPCLTHCYTVMLLFWTGKYPVRSIIHVTNERILFMAQLSPVVKQATPVVVEKAEGNWVLGTDGVRYLDFTSGIEIGRAHV